MPVPFKKRNWLQTLLDLNERNANWLSRKLGVSHTLVYNWCKGLGEPSKHQKRWIKRILK